MIWDNYECEGQTSIFDFLNSSEQTAEPKHKNIKIVSLFDGMACGALAFESANISIEKYIAFEVEQNAIKNAVYNFPFIEERGDVFKADFKEFKGFDWLIGGSPCTYWSIAQTQNRETSAQGIGWELFKQYLRALEEMQPHYFIYENNASMSKAIKASITEAFGFEPILINSALVSAQTRKRLYWVGIRNDKGKYNKADIKQPQDAGVAFADVIEAGGQDLTGNSKAWALTASYAKGAEIKNTITKHQKNIIAVESESPKAYQIQNGFITYKGKKYKTGLTDGRYILRNMTLEECKRLQTVPAHYEFITPLTASIKCLGNGWTVEVIAHLIRETLGGE